MIRAPRPGALGERLRDVNRIGVAVARNVDAAEHIVQVDERVERSDLGEAHDVKGRPNVLAMEHCA